MAIFRKIITLFALFLLLVLISLGAFSQTNYFREKVQKTIFETTEGAITIEKIGGFFPFWLTLHHVRYQADGTTVTIRRANTTVSIYSLFVKQLTFFHIHLEDVQINSSGSGRLSWPNVPIAINVHSLKVDHLKYNDLHPVDLQAAFELHPFEGDFSATVNIFPQNLSGTSIHMSLQKDAHEQLVAVITNVHAVDPLSQLEHANLWAGGLYSLDSSLFSGACHGNGHLLSKEISWDFTSDITIDQNFLLSLPKMHLSANSIEVEGQASYLPSTNKFHFRGELAQELLTFDTSVTTTPDGWVNLHNISLNYLNNGITGNLAYQPKNNRFEGELAASLFHIQDSAPILHHFFHFDQHIEGDLSATLQFTNQSLEFDSNLQNFGFQSFFVSSGHCLCSWKSGEELEFALNIFDFDILEPSFEVFPLVHLEAQGSVSKKLLQFSGLVGGLGTKPFEIGLKLPIALSFVPIAIDLDRQTPFSMTLKGEGAIDPLLAFLENASMIVQGDLEVDLEISGLIDDSSITGFCALSNGTLQDLTTGALYQKIDVQLVGKGETLEITQIVATDGDKGTITGSGTIDWNFEEHFPFTLDIEAKSFNFLTLDPFTANVDAQINVTGSTEAIAIGGNATILEGQITIPNKLPVSIPTLDVTYVNPLPQFCKVETVDEPLAIAVHWDLKVVAPKNLHIEGRGHRSEWKGNIHIAGEGKDLTYSGKLKLITGQFELGNSLFILSTGSIRIEGINAKDIYIDVNGNEEISTLVVFVNLKGYLDNTKMTFTSNPPMSTQQIFSRILFDTDLNELTPMQACRLAKFLITLSGNYSGPSVFDDFKESLGIDVLDITHCDISEADFTFQVGKYISQGTFVGINKSLSGNFDSVIIQTRLFRDFFIEADYGGSLNGLTPNSGKFVFKWYRTY